MRQVRTLHGDLVRDGRVIGSWSAKWARSGPRGPGGRATAVWDCHVTVNGRTERFDATMPADKDDLQVMQGTIARGQIAHTARREVRRAREKEENDE